MRRPSTASSAASRADAPVGMPALVEGEVLARRQPQRPSRPRRARHAEVRVPPERHRHLPVGGGHEHGVDRRAGRRAAVDRELEQVRERERGRVDDGRRGEAGDVASRARARHLPVGRARRAGRGSASRCRRCGDAADGGRRRRPRRGSGATRAGWPRARAAAARRCVRRAARRRHPGAPGARGDHAAATRRSCPRRARTWRAARRCAVRSPACPGSAARRPRRVILGGHFVGQTSSRFSTMRSPAAYWSSTPGLIEYSGMRRCHSRSVTRSSRRARCEPRQRCTPPPNAR